jgi:hypothetical protein
MSTIPGGVRVGGFIAPNDGLDTYAVTNPFYGLGSLRSVDSIAIRDSITTDRREEGMLVYVKEDAQYYQLLSGLTNTDWVNLNLTAAVHNTFSVTATGVNSYTGTSIPSITGYSTGVIYLTTFDNSNTTASTINIDSLSTITIYKATTSGLTDLDAGDIQTGLTYFLTYDGVNMQMFTSNPAPAVPNSYTNPAPTTATLGGIPAGSTFSAQTMQEMFDALLYPYQTPSFSSFSRGNLSSTYELGQTVLIGSQTFTWGTSNSPNVSAGTVSIIQNFSPSKTLYGPSNNIFSTATTLVDTYSADTSTTTTLYTINATNTHGASLSTTISRSWRPRWYYGKFSGATLNASELITLSTSALVSSVVNTYYAISSSVGSEYVYFAIPNTLTQPSDFRDSTGGCFGTNHPYAVQGTVSVINVYGVTINYTVYRFTNPTAGALNAWLCP